MNHKAISCGKEVYDNNKLLQEIKEKISTLNKVEHQDKSFGKNELQTKDFDSDSKINNKSNDNEQPNE